jgi:hypothetical protein
MRVTGGCGQDGARRPGTAPPAELAPAADHAHRGGGVVAARRCQRPGLHPHRAAVRPGLPGGRRPPPVINSNGHRHRHRPRPGLAAQYGQLMTEHQEFQVVGGIAAGQLDEQLDGAAHGQVGELRRRAGASELVSGASHYRARMVRTASSQALSDFAHPTATGLEHLPDVAVFDSTLSRARIWTRRSICAQKACHAASPPCRGSSSARAAPPSGRP